MDYEKAYKEALKRADTLTEKYGGRDFAEYVFPELAESEDDRMIKAIEHILYENYTDAAVIEGVEIAEIVTWLEKRKGPQWKPSEEQIANATYNDLAEVYERIRTEMLRRHQDIVINIKEGQQ